MDYPYENLEYNGRLVFKDAFGLEAYFHCYQRLRVLAPEIFSITRRAWGDGDPIQQFVSPSAAAVQLVPDGDCTAVVVVLKRPARQGDEIEVHSIRRLHHAFKSDRPKWEFIPFSPTGRVRLAISFPLAKEATGIAVSMSAGAPSPYVRRPGLKELTMMIANPTVGSLYRADWSW